MKPKYLLLTCLATLLLVSSLYLVIHEEECASDAEYVAISGIRESLDADYDTFDAYVNIDGKTVYGIGFTDYSYAYSNDDSIVNNSSPVPYIQTKVWFASGFIALDYDGTKIENNCPIIRLGEELEKFGYILTYDLSDIYGHFILDKGYVTFNVEDSDLKISKHYLGNSNDTGFMNRLFRYLQYEDPLYSYDDELILVDPNNLSSWQEFDIHPARNVDVYKRLSESIKTVNELQDSNWVSMDIRTIVRTSAELMTAYLSAIHEESFMGYSVKELIEFSQNVSKDETIVIDDSGLVVMTAYPPRVMEEAMKWIFTLLSVAVVAVACVVPMNAIIAGAMIGAGFTLFQQAQKESYDLNDLLIGVISGALSGFASTIGGFSGFAFNLIAECIPSIDEIVHENITFDQALDVVFVGMLIGSATSSIVDDIYNETILKKGFFKGINKQRVYESMSKSTKVRLQLIQGIGQLLDSTTTEILKEIKISESITCKVNSLTVNRQNVQQLVI